METIIAALITTFGAIIVALIQNGYFNRSSGNPSSLPSRRFLTNKIYFYIFLSVLFIILLKNPYFYCVMGKLFFFIYSIITGTSIYFQSNDC